jgi:hypothetical protein
MSRVAELVEVPAAGDTPGAPFSHAFQPIVDVSTRRILAYEALIRGAHNEPAFQVFARVGPHEVHALDRARGSALARSLRLGIDCNLAVNVLPRGLEATELSASQFRSDTEAVAKNALIRDRLSGVPGVRGVTATAVLPLENLQSSGRWGTNAALGDPTKFRQGQFHVVAPSYFETMRGRLIAGRTFSAEDDMPNARTIVIDDRVPAMAFPNESPLRKYLPAGIATPEPEPSCRAPSRRGRHGSPTRRCAR